MFYKVSDQKGVVFTINKSGECLDIDVDEGVTAVRFSSMLEATKKAGIFPSNSFLAYHCFKVKFKLKDVKKQFPNVKELILSDDLPTIEISNFMFPNVSKITSTNGYFQDGASMLIEYSGILKNTFCKKTDEVLDMSNVTIIEDWAFEGCMSENLIHVDNIKHVNKFGLTGSALELCRRYKDGIFSIGNSLIDIEPGRTVNFPSHMNIDIYHDLPGRDVVIHEVRPEPCYRRLTLDSITIHLDKKNQMMTPEHIVKNFSYFQSNDIIVSDDNPFYCSIDGVVFTKDKKMLVLYPSNRKGGYKIPEGTETISYRAFDESLITEVIIPDSVSSIEEEAFLNCHQLRRIKFNNSIYDYESFCGAGIFSCCEHLEEVEFPSGIQSIGESMFSGCDIEKISLPEGLKRISDWAFSNCHCREVFLPSSLRKIGPGNFMYAETIHIKGRMPKGLMVDITRPQYYNHGLGESFLIKLVMHDSDGEMNLYVPRYITPEAAEILNNYLSTFSWCLLPSDYFDNLLDSCPNEIVMQETAIQLYREAKSKKAGTYLKAHIKKIINRYIKENREETIVLLISFGFMSAKLLDSLLKTAQDKNMSTVVAYILAEKQKIESSKNKKNAKATTSFRI